MKNNELWENPSRILIIPFNSGCDEGRSGTMDGHNDVLPGMETMDRGFTGVSS